MSEQTVRVCVWGGGELWVWRWWAEGGWVSVGADDSPWVQVPQSCSGERVGPNTELVHHAQWFHRLLFDLHPYLLLPSSQ